MKPHSAAEISRKNLLRIVLGCLTLLLLVAGGRTLYRWWSGAPLTPVQARKVIARYLEEHSGQARFQAALPLTLSNPPAFLLITNKSGKVKKRKLQVESPYAGMSRDFRQQLTEAGDYGTIYRLIGEHLAAAEALLASTNGLDEQAGLMLAMEANRAALGDASDPWLAARIVEGYLWPHLSSAQTLPGTNPLRVGKNPPDTSGRGGNERLAGVKRPKAPGLPAGKKIKVNAEAILALADRSFREAEERQNLVRNYQLMIRTAPKASHADKARYRLARLYEDQSNWKAALRCYGEMQDTNNAKIQQRISLLKRRLASR